MSAARERFHCPGMPNAHLWTNSNKCRTQSNRGQAFATLQLVFHLRVGTKICAGDMQRIMTFQIKRIYEPASPDDGLRVLVDRLWPRGLKKERAMLTAWLKEIAPSNALRVWFDHRPERFAEFARRYRKELVGNATLDELQRLGAHGTTTLLYGAHDPKINHAAVLLAVLRARARRLRSKNNHLAAGKDAAK